MSVKIKGSDFLAAIEKNGYPHIQSEWVQRDIYGKVMGACAIGQALVNLNINVESFIDRYANDSVINSITHYNDEETHHEHTLADECITSFHSWDDVVKFAKERFESSGYLDAEFEVELNAE